METFSKLFKYGPDLPQIYSLLLKHSDTQNLKILCDTLQWNNGGNLSEHRPFFEQAYFPGYLALLLVHHSITYDRSIVSTFLQCHFRRRKQCSFIGRRLNKGASLKAVIVCKVLLLLMIWSCYRIVAHSDYALIASSTVCGRRAVFTFFLDIISSSQLFDR